MKKMVKYHGKKSLSSLVQKSGNFILSDEHNLPATYSVKIGFFDVWKNSLKVTRLNLPMGT